MSGAAGVREGSGRRLGRRTLAAAATLVVAGSVAAAGYAVAARPRDGAAVAAAPVPVGTAQITRGTVTETVKIAGTLGYDGSYPVINQLAPGILTSVAAEGGTVTRGGTLYAVANRPVRLLYGTVPGYRGFAAGMADGPDVAQLEANLVALGMDRAHTMTVDDHFTAATAGAIRRWQASWGVPSSRRTGALAPGEVVFLPGALRVEQERAQPGTQVGPGTPVLTGSSTSRVVSAQLTTDRQSLVHRGDRVQVSVAGTPPVDGTVVRIGRVATAPAGDGPAPGGGGGAGGPTAGGPASVTVTVALALPSGAGDLDQAPAQVAIVTARHADVLLVPVTALLARPGGGYQVRLASGGYVAVRPGLFDDDTGTVEVDGAGLSPGDRVEVPAP